MSAALVEDLHLAEAAVVEAEGAVAAARRAEVEALVAGDSTGAGERRKRLAAALANLDAALSRLDLLREAVGVGAERDARTLLEQEVLQFRTLHRTAEAAWTRAEGDVRDALVALTAALARQRAAHASLKTAVGQLEKRIGPDAPGIGAAWEPVTSPNRLQLLVDSLRADIATSLGSQSTVNRPVEIAVPVLDVNMAQSAKE